MPTVFELIPDFQQFEDDNGNLLSGGLLFIYSAGSSTKATTYTESDGVTANANPIVLNSRGEMPNGCYVESGTYKAVLAPANDTDPPTSAIRTRDNLTPKNDTSTTVDQFVASGLAPTFVNATQFTVPGDQRTELHVGRRIRTSNSGGTGYHTITVSAFGALTTVTVVNEGVGLDAGLASLSLGLLRADDKSAIPGVEVSEDDWTFQGNATVEGNVSVAGTLSATGDASLGSVDASGPMAPRGYLSGLGLSNGTDAAHDIDIAAGVARDDGDAVTLRLASTLTKQIDAAWAAGDDAGGLDTGSVAADTWYSAWLIRRSDTGVVDALFSTSASSPTMPTDYDQKRRIGWVRTNGSSDIIAFHQRGDLFYWDDPDTNGLDESNETVSTTAESLTLLFCPPSVEGMLNVGATGTSTGQVGLLVYATDMTDPTSVNYASNSLVNVGSIANGTSIVAAVNQIRIYVDASRQVRAMAQATTTVDVQAMGWWDARGKD